MYKVIVREKGKKPRELRKRFRTAKSAEKYVIKQGYSASIIPA